jgi:hypothetical protein
MHRGSAGQLTGNLEHLAGTLEGAKAQMDGLGVLVASGGLQVWLAGSGKPII